MKKIIAVLSLLIWVLILFEKGYLPAEKYFTCIAPKALSKVIKSLSPPAEEKPPFDVDETFNFYYNMGPIRAGYSKLAFLGKASFEGKDAYLISFESKVGVFYDLEKIYANPKTFYPIYVHRDIKNLGISSIIEERYDQVNYQVEILKQGILGRSSETIKKQGPIQNALLLTYSCRMLNFEKLQPGYEFYVVLPVDEFKVIFKKIDKIRTSSGTFDAYLFESEPAKIRLWISTDDKHIPLKMENLTSFGPSSIIFEE